MTTFTANAYILREVPNKGFEGTSLRITGDILLDRGAWTNIPFDLEWGDTNAYFDAPTSPSEITIPNAGIYLLIANANVFTPTGSHPRGIGVRFQSGAQTLAYTSHYQLGYTNVFYLPHLATAVQLSGGEKLTLDMFSNEEPAVTQRDTVASGSNSPGNVAVIRPDAQVGVRVGLVSDSSPLTASTWTPIAFDTEVFDTSGFHESITNPTRLTIPAGQEGIYAAIIAVEDTLGAETGTLRQMRILKNGVDTVAKKTDIPISALFTATNNLPDQVFCASTILHLGEGDYIEAEYWSEESNSVVGAAQTHLSLIKVGEVNDAYFDVGKETTVTSTSGFTADIRVMDYVREDTMNYLPVTEGFTAYTRPDPVHRQFWLLALSMETNAFTTTTISDTSSTNTRRNARVSVDWFDSSIESHLWTVQPGNYVPAASAIGLAFIEATTPTGFLFSSFYNTPDPSIDINRSDFYSIRLVGVHMSVEPVNISADAVIVDDIYTYPMEDTHLGNWTDNLGNTIDIFTKISEFTPDDSDYVQSENSPSNSPYVAKLLGNLNDIGYVNYRYAKNHAEAPQIDLTIELREGYVSEASPGTLIASWTHTNISATETEANQLVSLAEQAAITDFTDLYLRFVANAP